jgi:hypothetical protein
MVCLVLCMFGWIIFPIYYCCCQPEADVEPRTFISDLAYKKMEDLGSMMRLSRVSLVVQDNYLSPKKIECLKQLLQRSKARKFMFVNEATMENGERSEWTGFQANMDPITSLVGVSSSITWGDVHLEN